MTGQMISAADAAAVSSTRSAEKKKEKTREALWDALLAHLEWIDEQIEFWEERLGALSRQETALEKLLKRIRAGEDPELDENGGLRDRDAEQAIGEYEKRHGVRVDRANLDPATIQLILESVREEKDFAARKVEALEQERDRVRRLDPDDPRDAKEIEQLGQEREGRIALDAAGADELKERNLENVRRMDRYRGEAQGYEAQDMVVLEDSLDPDEFFAEDNVSVKPPVPNTGIPKSTA